VTGTVYIADTLNSRVFEVAPGGTQTTVGSGLSFPDGVTVDLAGDVFIADTDNNRVVEVPAGGGRPSSPSSTSSRRSTTRGGGTPPCRCAHRWPSKPPTGLRSPTTAAKRHEQAPVA